MTATTAPVGPVTPLRDAPRTERPKPQGRRTRPIVVEARAAISLQRRGKATFIDLRDWEALDRTGWVQGSLHCPPGEFATLLDPASPLHARLFEPGGTFVFYGGPKAAPLAAARRARALGLEAVALRGGLGAWRAAGGKTAGHPASALPVLKISITLAFRSAVADVRRGVARLKRRYGMHGPTMT